jgi:hypothetical protein
MEGLHDDECGMDIFARVGTKFGTVLSSLFRVSDDCFECSCYRKDENCKASRSSSGSTIESRLVLVVPLIWS